MKMNIHFKFTSEKPLVSIILVNYNGLSYLKNCIESLINSQYSNFEIIIIDNGSGKCDLDFLEHLSHTESKVPIKVHYMKTNVGFAKANNIGLSMARGDYIVFLNVDTMVDSLWLGELVKIAESDPNIAVCQSKLLKTDAPNFLDGAGDFPTRHGIPYIRGYNILDKGYDKVEEIFSARGAAMLVKRNILKSVGGFDDSYFCGYEDVDLCWRIHLAGYKVVFVPTSIVYHKGGALTSAHEMIALHKHKNFIMTAIKNYCLINLLKELPLILIGRMILCFCPLKELRKIFGSVFSFFKALFWVMKNFPKIYRKRLIVQHIIRKIPDAEALCLMPGLKFEILLLKSFIHKLHVKDFWQCVHTQFKVYMQSFS